MQRMGVGIIGLGMAVKPHALALRDLADQVDVIGGYSPTPERRSEFARSYGLPTVDSLDALLGDPRVEAVLILTPPRTHAELAVRAAQAGKHVLLEKPVDVTLQQARAVVDAVEREGRKLGVVFQYRFRPGTVDPAQAAAGRRAGRIAQRVLRRALVAPGRVLRAARPRHARARRRRRAADAEHPHARCAAGPGRPGAARERPVPHQPAAQHRHRGYRVRCGRVSQRRGGRRRRNDGRLSRLSRAHRSRRHQGQRGAGSRAAGRASRLGRSRCTWMDRAPAAVARIRWPSRTSRIGG